MSPTIGQRIKLIEASLKKIDDQQERLYAEIHSIIREISLDIPDEEG